MEQEWGCEMGRRRVMFYLRQEDAHRDYFNALRKGTRHAEVSVEAWSAHDKLLPQAIESISRSRTPPILSRAQARFAMVRGSSGKAQLAGFAKAHRCHRGGRGDCAADSQAFRRRSKRESRERERRKVRKCSTWRHYKKPSSDTVIEGLIRGR